MKGARSLASGARTPISVASELAALVLAGTFAASALLPSATDERPALLAVAALLGAWTLVWFRVIPRAWFGRERPFIGSSIMQLIAGVLIAVTGGSDSFYFGYYFVPVLVTVFQLRPAATLVVGTLGLAVYWLIFLLDRDAADVTVRDTALIRSMSYVAIAAVSWLLTRALVRGQRELTTERSRLSALIDALKEPILVTTDGIVSSANASALSFFGAASRGRRLADVMPGVIGTGPAQLVDVTGRAHHVEVAQHTLPGDGKTVVWAAYDVSHHAEANRAREQLLYSVAHELRGPLAVLGTSLDLVETDIGSLTMAELQDLLARARRSVGRMRSLMEDLLSAGNIQAGRFVVNAKDVALAQLFSEAVELSAASVAEHGQRVTSDFAADLHVRADPRYIRQVLNNLLSNASRYGGNDTEITVRAEAALTHVRVAVADRGPGIPAEQRTGLFERFYRLRGTSDGGVGLGLAIAKGIVEAHGGSIGVDSEVGRGTTVWFTLPATGWDA